VIALMLCSMPFDAFAVPHRKPVITKHPCLQLNKAGSSEPCETQPEPPSPPPPSQGGIPNEICCQTSEMDHCADGLDNDCDGYCDAPGSHCASLGTRQVLAGDPDCCPDDYNPCTKAVIRNGGCTQQFIIGCRYCEIAEDCLDGNEDTLDYCVSGRCAWIESSEVDF